jgi:predicted regulator of Ras-like GTPase activity (Roadblock/LC7/MglB family)
MGDAFEQIQISEKALLVMRRFGAGNVAIFVCGPDQHLGRLRFEIRCLAEHL